MFNEIEAKLKAPFPADRISWRVGSTNKDKTKGMALAYIDARDVMDRLDDVVGPQNWQDRYTATDGKTVCEIDIWVEGRGWVTKADGAGDSDVEAEKGALSDAFKRAAVRWGIGRYLYDLDSPWVPIEPMGRSFKIADSAKATLARIANGVKGPAPRQAANQAPADDSDPFTEESGGVQAAKLSIDLCKTPADLKTWTANNSGALDLMSEDERGSVRLHYSKRLAAVKLAQMEAA